MSDLNAEWSCRFATEESKRALTRQIFDTLAPRYELICQGYSFGRDGAWKRDLIRSLPDHPNPVCVDLACGTGALTRALATRYPRGRVIGLDASEAMLAEARNLHAGSSVEFTRGDMQQTPWADASVDVVTGGYALRNAPDVEATIREIARILKPGGSAAFLDFCHSDWEPYARLIDGLLRVWGGLWGWVLFRKPAIFTYVAESLLRYPKRTELRRMLSRAGLRTVRSRRYMFGALETIRCVRDPARPAAT